MNTLLRILCLYVFLLPFVSNAQIIITNERVNVVSEQLFGINAVFHYPGISSAFEGTGKSVEFFEMLDSIGVRLIRFPGGSTSHYYDPYSETNTSNAKNIISRNNILLGKRKNNKGYRKGSFSHGNYVDAFSFISACNSNNFPIIFQLNTSTFSHESEPFVISDPSDINLATAYLSKFLDSLNNNGLKVDYFEIGNEDFTKYSFDLYFAIAKSYIEKVKKVFPNSKIIVTGDKFLAHYDDSNNIADFISTHYPYNFWPKPTMDTLKSFSQSDVGLDESIIQKSDMLKKSGIEIKLAVTENSFYRYSFNWPVSRLNPTHAHALGLIWNWIDLIKSKDLSIAIYHDLESPFFGLVKYRASFNSYSKQYKWDKSAGPYYIYTLSSYAFKLLSNHANGMMLGIENVDERLKVLATRNENTLLITLANNTEDKISTSIYIDQSYQLEKFYWITNGEADLNSTQSDAYKKVKRRFFDNKFFSITCAPFSFYQIELRID